MSPEDARSDFILAAAAVMFGRLVLRLLFQVLPLPDGLVAATLIDAVALFAVTGLVPLLLLRYRKQGPSGYGLEGPAASASPGLLLALPFFAVWVISAWAAHESTAVTFAGRLAPQPDVVLTVVSYIHRFAEFAGLLLLFGFLIVRARDGFRRNDVRQLEALRSYGIAAAAIALVLGLLLMLAPDQPNRWNFVLQVAGLVALVLLADRFVETKATTTRATVLAPAFVALLARWDIFGGNFLLSLYIAVLAAGAVIVMAVLVETRTRSWTIVPMLAASVIWFALFSPGVIV